MPTSTLPASAVAALLLLPFAAQAAPSLLVNGSFETNAVAPGTWNVFPTLTGWQGAPNIELRNQNFGLAQDGQQFVELDTFGNSAMSQAVSTGAGQHYTLSWYYSPRAGVAAASNPIEVYWNGVLLATNGGSGLGQPGHQWQLFSADVIGSGGLDELRFVATGSSDSLGGSLDNVALVAAVPEPRSLALAALGLLCLGASRRRRD